MSSPNEDYCVQACGACGKEGPRRDGELEACVQAKGGMFCLLLCPACRKTLTVAQALELLTGKAPPPQRIGIMERMDAMEKRLRAVEKKQR